MRIGFPVNHYSAHQVPHAAHTPEQIDHICQAFASVKAALPSDLADRHGTIRS